MPRPETQTATAIGHERAVLGAAMMDAGALAHVTRILTPDQFNTPLTIRIAESIWALDAAGQAVDAVTVTHHACGQPGSAVRPTDVMDCLSACPSVGVAESYALIVRQAAMLRHLNALGQELVTSTTTPMADPFAVVESIERQMTAVVGQQGQRRLRPASEARTAWWDRMQRRLSGATGAVAYGFRALDEATGGMHPGDKIVWAADSSTGKTTFAVSVTRHVAIAQGRRPLYISTEESADRLYERLTYMQAGVSARMGRRHTNQLREHEWDELGRAADIIDRSGLMVYDGRGITAQDVASVVRRAVRNNGADFVVVDNLHNLVGKGSMEEVTRDASGIHKSLALDLNVPVVEVSQLTLDRPGERPNRGHIRGSKAIFNDADVVMLLYRPELYGIEWSEKWARPTERMVEVIVEKAREDGAYSRGMLLTFDPHTVQVRDGAPPVRDSEGHWVEQPDIFDPDGTGHAF